MSKHITALRVQKRERQRVNVYLDGCFAFGLADVEAAGLRIGQVLSDEEITELRERDEVQRAVDRALNLLSYRPRSQAEIRTRLRQKGYSDTVVAQVLERLGRVELADDREFASYWVENRFQFNPLGVLALRQELRLKGLDEPIIDQALAGYDEESAAARAAEVAVRRLHQHDLVTFRRKLYSYLSRRGFPYHLIEPLVEVEVAKYASGEPLERREG